MGIAPGLCAAQTLFEEVGEHHKVDPLLLRAIATHESTLNPHALNINGISVPCDSADAAYQGLGYVQKRPWHVPLPEGSSGRLLGIRGRPNCVFRGTSARDHAWFASRERAAAFVAATGLTTEPERRNVASTDVGLMQINLAAHGEQVESVERLLYDPRYNVSYAAAFLNRLARRDGAYNAIAHYHHGDLAVSGDYRAAVVRRYQRLLQRYDDNSGERALARRMNATGAEDSP